MHVAIAGAHGKIGLRLARRLAADGTEVVGLIRNPDHAAEVEAAGGRAVVCDLEGASVEAVTAAIAGAEVVVFTAGAGAGSGAARKLTMDRDGAIKLLEASTDARYLMVSSVGADDPPAGDEVFSVYLQAKAAADAAVIASGRDHVIVRPGPLGDDPGTGRVRVSTERFRGPIARDNVAAILAELIAHPVLASRQVIYVADGDQPVADALAAIGPA